jgi:uridine kinase
MKFDNVFTISLFGPTAVGKGTISKSMIQQIPFSNRLVLDYCMRNKRTDESLLEYVSSDNTDWILVKSILSNPVGTKVSLPIFEYDTFTRINNEGGKEFEVSKIVILDGLYPYLQADLIIGLRLDDQIRKERFTKRHFGERNQVDKTWYDFCISNWNHMPNTSEMFSSQCDMLIDTALPLNDSLKKIVDVVKLKVGID